MTITRVPKPKRKVSANKLRQTLYWLSQDWIHLNRTLPVPATGEGRQSNMRAYGHPAEWASDQCAKIADLMWNWHDLVADRRGETPPTPPTINGQRTRREQDIIVAAWRYLEPRIEEVLAETVPFTQLRVPYRWEWAIDDEAFQEIFDLHRHIRNRTGQSNAKTILPMPCPNYDCGMLALVRAQGMAQDFVICGACGYTVPDTHYKLLTRILLDTLTNTAA